MENKTKGTKLKMIKGKDENKQQNLSNIVGNINYQKVSTVKIELK